MKAPHEVWVDGEDAYTTASTDERQRVRYLRADLSCQECDQFVKFQNDKPCWCPMGMPPFAVACMAFVPKEER